MDLTSKVLHPQPEQIAEVFFWKQSEFGRLQEGKFVSGRFEGNIRIDNATYGAGQRHAHILGRKGNDIGVVNVDGTSSHGTICRLHPNDIEALRANGFKIPDSGIVEWISLGMPGLQFLFN